MLKTHFLALSLLVATPTIAFAANYDDGVQIGSKQTLAQAEHARKQAGIARQGGYRHESEHVSGSIFLFKVLKNLGGGVYADENEEYFEDEEQAQGRYKNHY